MVATPPPSQRNQRTAGEPAQVSLHLNTCSYTIEKRIYIYIDIDIDMYTNIL